MELFWKLIHLFICFRVTLNSCRVEYYFLILFVTTMAPMANGWYVVSMVTHSPELRDVQLGLGVWGVTVGIID